MNRRLSVVGVCALAVIASIFAASCASAPWLRTRVFGKPLRIEGEAVRIIETRVERRADAGSIELEIARLTRLLLAERGLVFSDEGDYRYGLYVRAAEREYLDGFQARRSIRVEIDIVPFGESESVLSAYATATEPGSLASAICLEELLSAAADSLMVRIVR